MAEPIQIEWLKKKPALCQAYETGLEYSFIDGNNNQVCCFVTCKDFLQDAITAMYHKKKIEIYGFKYDAAKDRPVYADKTRIAIANSQDKKFSDKIPAMIDLVNQVERKLHLIRTTATAVANPPKKYEKCGVFVLDSSSRWMLSPPMLSLYTLLIRVGFVHKIGDDYSKTFKRLVNHKIEPYQESDAEQLSAAQSGIERILKYGYAKLFYKDPERNFPDVPIESMHNYYGIVSYATGQTKSRMKYWHRDPDKKPKPKKADEVKKAEEVVQ